jgi:hypothetical protein
MMMQDDKATPPIEKFAEQIWLGLNDCSNADAKITIKTVTHWIEHSGAGYPDVPLLQDTIKADAELWADAASDYELEAYMAAALGAMGKMPIYERAAKHLAALSYKSLGLLSRDKFKAWTEKVA